MAEPPEESAVCRLAELVAYQPGTAVSRTLVKRRAGTVSPSPRARS